MNESKIIQQQSATTFDESRSKSFYKSLNKVLTQVASDKIVKQMLSSPNSFNFVTNRVGEIIKNIIDNDREIHIRKLSEKLQKYRKATENIDSEQIRSLGKQVIDAAAQQNQKELFYKKQIKTQENQINKLQSEVSELRAQLALKQVNSQPQIPGKLNPKVNLIKSYDPELIKLKNHIRDVKTELLTEASMLNSMKLLFNTEFKTKLNTSKLLIAHLVDKISNLQSKLNTERELRVQCQQRYEEEIIPNLMNNQKEISEKHKEINESRLKDIESIKTMLTTLRNEKTILQSQVKTYKSLNEELKKDNAKNQQLISNFRISNNQLKSELEDYRFLVSERDNKIRSLELELFNANEAKSSLNNELFAHKQMIEELNVSNDQNERNVNLMKLENATKDQKYQSLSLENQRLKETINSMQEKLDIEIQTKFELTDKFNTYHMKYETLKREINSLQRSLNDCKSDNMLKDQAINESRKENESLKTKIVKLELNIDSLENSITERLEESRDLYNKEIFDLQNKLKRLQLQYEKQNSTIVNQKVTVEGLNEQIERQKRNLMEVIESKDKLEKQKSAIEKELNDLRKSNIELKIMNEEEKHKNQILIQRMNSYSEEP